MKALWSLTMFAVFEENNNWNSHTEKGENLGHLEMRVTFLSFWWNFIFSSITENKKIIFYNDYRKI